MATDDQPEPGTGSPGEGGNPRPRRPRRPRPIMLDGERLSRRALLDIAQRGRRVRLHPYALRRVGRAASFLAGQLKRGEALYGVTTGFGSNADRLLGEQRLRARPGTEGLDLIEELQRNLIVSHAVCVGEPLPPEVVRAMLAIRVNTLLRGHSGVRGQTLKLMVELLNRDIVPLIPSLGSVGASGDLAPLSHMALPLLGIGEVWHRGERKPAAEALAEEGLEAIALGVKEGLALNNGTALMLALAVIALDRLEAAVCQADVNAALVLEAFCGRSGAFDARVHELRPHPGQVATAANLRDLIAGSQLIDIPYHRVPRFVPWTPEAWGSSDPTHARTFDMRWDYVLPGERAGRAGYYQRHLPFRGGKRAQPQDAYSLRCIPQVHGAVKDALVHLREVVDIELNAITDNPLVFAPSRAADDEEDGAASRVVSAGNFHGMPIALALAAVKAAIPVQAAMAERRIAKLVDPATSDGLPPFLVGNEDGTDSGLMIVQYTAAALVNRLATMAHPASVHSIPTSANAEDHVSMGANEALDVQRMCEDLEQVLALELLVATQALEYRLQILEAAATTATQLGTEALRRKIRNISPGRPEDAGTLAEDIKRLQADLKQLRQVRPGAAAALVLQAVRAGGIRFLDHDRHLAPDLGRAVELVRSRRLLVALEQDLHIELRLS